MSSQRRTGLTQSQIESLTPVAGGLNASQVDARIQVWARAGSLTPIPLPEEIRGLGARVEALEEEDDVLHSRVAVLTNHRVVVASRNTAISLGVTLGLTGPDEGIIVVVTAVGEPDGRSTFKRSALIAAGTVVRDGAALTSANGIEWTNPPDDRKYRLGIDSTGDVFFSADTGDTYLITLVRYITDTTQHLRFATDGDVEFSRSVGGVLKGDLRDGSIDNDALAAVVRTAINDKAIAGAFSYDASTGILTIVDGAGSAGNDINIPRPTELEIYNLLKAILVDGANITSTETDATRRISIAAATAGGGTATDLSPAALPLADASALAVGLIRNYVGTEYTVIAGTDRPNQHHILIGTAGSGPSAGGYVGDATMEWDSVNFRFNPLKSEVAAPPARLYLRYQDTEGQHVEIVLSRAAASDTATRYAYNLMPGTAVEPDPGATATLSVFTDVAGTTPFNFQASGNRWIPLHLPDTDVDVVALKSSSARWPKTKVPSDTVYDADVAIDTVWTGTAAQFAALTRASGNKTLYLVTS